MPNIPCCFLCSRSPADLKLLGEPVCEPCAHAFVTESAARNRAEVADLERATARRRTLPPLVAQLAQLAA